MMLIHRLDVRGLLSFGPQGIDLDMRPLNVLIGPNGSGKSNLLDSIALLKAAPRELAGAISRRGDSVRDWIWSGEPAVVTAAIEAILEDPEGSQKLRVDLKLTEGGQRLNVADERIADERALTVIRDRLHGIRFYRAARFGRKTLSRARLKTDRPSDVLCEDGRNLGVVLDGLLQSPKVRTRLLDALHRLQDGTTDFRVIINGDAVRMFIHEGEIKVPATRMSDGTLRYLCLLAILCHPKPPPLVCIEEPELGLHPDVLPTLSELLVEASQRGQLIVTTHSEILVDALTHEPECVVVCEKHDGQTKMRRLKADELAKWLKRYGLGELWISGEIGGNRW